jgi:putative endonuclease
MLNGSHYVGSSRADDPRSRLVAHNSGKTRSTKRGRPWVLVHSEKYDSYKDAGKREIFLKSGFGRSLIKGLIK